MLDPSPAPATLVVERLRTSAGRRMLAISLVLLMEAFLLFLLLSLGSERQPADRERGITVVNVAAQEVPAQAPEVNSPEREQLTEERLVSQRPASQEPLPTQEVQPASPRAAELSPVPTSSFERLPSYEMPQNDVRPAPPGRTVYGPPDTGRSSLVRDSEQVGTAPNGEPLYAAAWYRKPRDDELRAYLSTARGPGWGLIACRTAPDYRVEDCVALSEYPEGSQINQAILAAAWEFKVRPPRRGGQSLVGSWVRIRIDYSIERR